MQKKAHSLVLFVLFMVIISVVLFSSGLFSSSSQAQTLDEFSYLPAVLNPSAPMPTPTPTPTTPPTIEPPDGMIYVDHNSVALFDQIPTQYLNAAAGIDMLFVNRSVGGNISDGLTCLSQPWASAPNNCKRHEHVVAAFSVDPSEVYWDGTYDRANWDYLFWPGVGDPNQRVNCSAPTDEWDGKVECFLEHAAGVVNNYDVLSFQFSYLEVGDGTIADPAEGFFANTPGYDVHELEAFEAQHSGKVIIYWTSSLSRGIGSPVSESFNQQMRNYAVANEKVLFDVAAILSHDPDGNPCYDNRDGVPYDNGNNSENYPDDGQNLLAICQHYTTETDGGHLGSVSAGKIRVAKAFWVLMAQLAGWQPNP